MSGNRRVQRSVRAIVATILLAACGLMVTVAVVTGVWVSAAAVGAVLVGAAALRIGHSEVVHIRRGAASARAAQARAFGADLTRSHREQLAFTAAMTARLAQRDRTVVDLTRTVRLAERRADDAEARVEREARRAKEMQERLSALLDEVLTQRAVVTADAEVSDISTVDLLAWEGRVSLVAAQSQQRAAASRLQA